MENPKLQPHEEGPVLEPSERGPGGGTGSCVCRQRATPRCPHSLQEGRQPLSSGTVTRRWLLPARTQKQELLTSEPPGAEKQGGNPGWLGQGGPAENPQYSAVWVRGPSCTWGLPLCTPQFCSQGTPGPGSREVGARWAKPPRHRLPGSLFDGSFCESPWPSCPLFGPMPDRGLPGRCVCP